MHFIRLVLYPGRVLLHYQNLLTNAHNNNNNNNNNIYQLQLGCHPVAVVILHVHKHGGGEITRKFKSGGLHERHVVAT